jgi:pantoate--beta-alanine ligase
VIEITDPAAMREWSRAERAEGLRVSLVPTMGYLHAGHLRLIDRARSQADRVVVSAFVNPLQFGPGEDYERYPRDQERDRAMARDRGVDCLFAPQRAAVFAPEPVLRIDPGSLGSRLCGPYRPGHFEGVLTIVAKLFHLVEPELAVFGRKDYQQAVLVQRLVTDLSFPVEIAVAPIVREADGLALSSRNAYLSLDERRSAPALAAGLEAAHQRFHAGVTGAGELTGIVREHAARAGLAVQYVEAVDPATLEPVAAARSDTVLAAAAFLGGTRLIDNIVLGEGTAGDEYIAARA